MNWAAIIGAVVQLVFLILSNYFNKNEEEKKKGEAIAKDLHEAIKNNDNDSITLALERIRLRRKK